jgi:hypothetical protein
MMMGEGTWLGLGLALGERDEGVRNSFLQHQSPE